MKSIYAELNEKLKSLTYGNAPVKFKPMENIAISRLCEIIDDRLVAISPEPPAELESFDDWECKKCGYKYNGFRLWLCLKCDNPRSN